MRTSSTGGTPDTAYAACLPAHARVNASHMLCSSWHDSSSPLRELPFVQQQCPAAMCVKSLTGKEIHLECEARSTIKDLKTNIQNKVGIPQDEQAFMFASKQLADDHTLSDEMRAGTLYLVLRKRGGPPKLQVVKTAEQGRMELAISQHLYENGGCPRATLLRALHVATGLEQERVDNEKVAEKALGQALEHIDGCKRKLTRDHARSKKRIKATSEKLEARRGRESSSDTALATPPEDAAVAEEEADAAAALAVPPSMS